MKKQSKTIQEVTFDDNEIKLLLQCLRYVRHRGEDHHIGVCDLIKLKEMIKGLEK